MKVEWVTVAFLPEYTGCVAISNGTDPPTVDKESDSSGKSCGNWIMISHH